MVTSDLIEDTSIPRTSVTSSSSLEDPTRIRQHHGDITTETNISSNSTIERTTSSMNAHRGIIARCPGEVAFFRLLHVELKKADRFFVDATKGFSIREERIVRGIKITKHQDSTGEKKWSAMAKSIYHLYKELLLLETFAIMNYCGFSKILKKHDKVTRYQTREAFMNNVVGKSSFAEYPRVTEMIQRCERLYEEVSGHLCLTLSEDESLFVNMIRQLNKRVLTNEAKDEAEGPDDNDDDDDDDDDDDESEDDDLAVTRKRSLMPLSHDSKRKRTV